MASACRWNHVVGRMKIYLAGPEVFLPNAKEVLKAKSELARSFGFTPLAPGDNQINVTGTPHERGMQINGFDEALMNEADGILANLTPFRGPGADPGTCYEVGYMCALGKAAFAYTNDSRNNFDRLKAHYAGDIREMPDGRIAGADGLSLENFDMAENLMLVGGIERRGGQVLVHSASQQEYYTDLTAYKECLRLMSEAFL